jgi:two-component system phosphate regulon sensor histidine kinase PhoR
VDGGGGDGDIGQRGLRDQARRDDRAQLRVDRRIGLERLVGRQPAVDLLGSESELSSALGNLVSNAIRYTPQDGEVRIIWRDAPEGSSFSVEDTGIGIAAEHLPRLTERFYRVDRSRSRETGGTGLGLAIVKHAIARHQAHLDVESKVGNGSRFTIRFPAKRTIPRESDLVRTRNSNA